MKSLLNIFIVCSVLLVHLPTCGQTTAAGFARDSGVAAEAPRPDKAPSAENASTAWVRGVIKCSDGLLPGAVVHLNGSRTYVATDANGSFELAVPASATTVEVTCSFVGFRDVVRRLKVKTASTTIVLDQPTALPRLDRSAETGWW